jgi:hypothetical protein
MLAFMDSISMGSTPSGYGNMVLLTIINAILTTPPRTIPATTARMFLRIGFIFRVFGKQVYKTFTFVEMEEMRKVL